MNTENLRAILPETLTNSPATANGRRHFELNEAAGSPKPKRNWKLLFKRITLAALVIFVGAGLAKFTYNWWTVGRFIESTDDAYVGGNVTVIAPEVSGFITRLAVEDNQEVRAGDLLVQLNDRDYQAALARAEAAVAIQRATQTNLDATRHLQEAVIAQAQADVTATDAEIIRTRADQVRYKKLTADGTEPLQSFERADASYKEAVAAGQKSQAALVAAQRQLDVIQTQEQETQATLQQAVAEEATAKLNLGYTELRAPIDGTVGNRSAQVGAYATTGAQLISLIPARGLWIDANFKENQLAHMQPGSSAKVTVDSIPGKVFHGHVVSIAPATGSEFSVLPPENATGNFTKIVQRVTVRIALDNEGEALGQLKPGLSVTAKVDTHSKSGL
ncbi:MAG TPA: HlyD family secretion protein [Pseudomonadales bacterium]|nr:HlyD family secretion protein [Pseudomonadales bacterium]